MSKTMIVTIRVATEVEDMLTRDCDALDRLREYGAAEVCHVECVNRPLTRISMKWLRTLPKPSKSRVKP